MESLPPDYREVIRLARLRRLPIKEVAQHLGRTPEATTQLLWRAVQKLRVSFGDTDSLHLPQRSLDQEGGAQ
jgi:RNA polymerase sigma factor (sigma-70 family)